MSFQNEVDDAESGNALMDTMTCNHLEVELTGKMDILDELNLNYGVKIEDNLVIDKRIETDEIRFRNIANDSFISILAQPPSGITYTLELPPLGPTANDFLYWDGSNNRLEWIEFVEGNDITIGITNNQITIGTSANSDKLIDSDEDTRISVEETTDEDTIRFYTQDIQVATMSITGIDLGVTNKITIRDDGTLKPASIDDSETVEDSIYFNNCQLVYKDPYGCIQPLYKDYGRVSLYGRQWSRVENNSKLFGSNAYSIINDVRYAPVGMCFLSKSSETIAPSKFCSVQTPGNSNLNDIDDSSDDEDNVDYTYVRVDWSDCSEIEMRKTRSTPHNGTYVVRSLLNEDCSVTSGVTLTGTSWTIVDNIMDGNVLFKLEGDTEEFPTGTWALSKRDQSISEGKFRITHSPGLSPSTQLRVRWLPNSPIEIRKTSTAYDGFYTYFNRLERTTKREYDVSLVGTSWTTVNVKLPKFRMTPVVSITTNVTDGPSAIFTLSKNKKLILPGKSQLAASPAPDNTRLRIRWLSASQIEIRKTTTNYDGIYHVAIH